MKLWLPLKRKWIAGGAATLTICLSFAYGLVAFKLIPGIGPFGSLAANTEADAQTGHNQATLAGNNDQSMFNSRGGDLASVGKVKKEQVSSSNFRMEVRQLLIAQTDAAHGLSSLAGTQRELIGHIQSALQVFDAKSATQQDKEALVIYLLSGGSPRGLTKLIDQLGLTGDWQKVVLGVRAFAVGDMDSARKYLIGIDASHFSPQLAARLQLVQATVSADGSIDVQQSLLLKAANTLPGTLVEEAALRRLVALDVKTNNDAAFVGHAQRYLRRFPKSLYIDEFVSTFVQGVVTMEDKRQKFDRSLLLSTLKSLPPEQSRKAVLDMAQRAATSGLVDLCLQLGSTSFRALLLNSKDGDRMDLYTSACSVLENPNDALKRLSELRFDDSAATDLKLQNDAMRMATAMLGQNSAWESSKIQGPELPDKPTADLLVSATQQLAASRKLIEESDR